MRPLRVIVPYAPGGGSGIQARLLQQKAGEDLGQQPRTGIPKRKEVLQDANIEAA